MLEYSVEGKRLLKSHELTTKIHSKENLQCNFLYVKTNMMWQSSCTLKERIITWTVI